MQSVPLAVLKLVGLVLALAFSRLHAIRTACGIETGDRTVGKGECVYCMQSVPLAVLKQIRSGCFSAAWRIACNPYRLRY